ncbi:hypothetical protein [Streptomyces sp. NPDC048192]|uniref:hypothetical protein n=1 Tax=Streptomyces sp. NPDC048192 TaxID=3365510 RepID=UPI0037225AD8
MGGDGAGGQVVPHERVVAGEGLAELRHWLTETRPQRTTRSDVLLRVFFLGVLESGQAHAYPTGLAGQSAELYDDLRRLVGTVDWDDDDLSVYGRIALEYGLRFYEMRRDWAVWAAEQVK